MDDTEGYADPKLAELMSRSTGPAINWLRQEGAKVIKAVSGNKIRWVLAPPKLPKPGHDWKKRGPHLTLQVLTNNLRKRGGDLMYRTRARHLVSADGRCVGLKAETFDGEIEIGARAVVLADSGFQACPELLRRFISPCPEHLMQRNAKTGLGDALQMAELAGAQLTDAASFYGHLLAQDALDNDEL